jgi:hypothetical protein
MVLFFFYKNLTDKELLKKISPNFDITDGYIIIESYDMENDILIINDKSKNNNTILYGKIVDFSNMKLQIILEKLSEIEECKFKKQKYTLDTIWANKKFGGVCNAYIIS